VNLVGELTPEDESVIIKPINMRTNGTSTLSIRQPTKDRIMENALPSMLYSMQ
jgi:virulence-associated protein VagC